ncbi:MAG TPA: hypothetical protein DEA91_09740 [Paenibacillus sp.]|nr:hypothetical protein [Paenibacillus sp.]
MVQFAMMYAMPWLVSRYGNAKVLISGILIVIIGMSCMSQISTDLKFSQSILIPMIVLGMGAGTVFIPFTSFGLSGVDPRDAGAASGLVKWRIKRLGRLDWLPYGGFRIVGPNRDTYKFGIYSFAE